MRCKYSDNHTTDILIGGDVKNLKDTFRFYRGMNVQVGLPMVRSIIKIHDGSLDIKSVPGKGTDISLSFPLA